MKIINLIKLEILKYKNNTLVLVLLLFFVLLAPTAINVMKTFNGPGLPNPETYYSFPNIWEYQAYFGSWISFIFLGYLAIYMITSEFQYKTLRQGIINGLSRKDFFTGKIATFIVISILATAVLYISTIFIGLSHQDAYDLDEVFEGQNYFIIRFFILTFAYMSFGMLIALLVRKSGLSMFLFFIYILILEPFIVRWWLHLKIFGEGKSMFYYPMNIIEDLAPFPLFKFSQVYVPKNKFFVLIEYPDAIVLSSVIIVIFLTIAYYLLTKRDI